MHDQESKPPADASSRSHGCDRAEGPCAVCRELTTVRVMQSDELLGGQREMFIVHHGQVYRLLCTKNDRLILQK
ncbi:MAG: hemin uptake protein HemP [Thermoguttaceae bacterium]